MRASGSHTSAMSSVRRRSAGRPHRRNAGRPARCLTRIRAYQLWDDRARRGLAIVKRASMSTHGDDVWITPANRCKVGDKEGCGPLRAPPMLRESRRGSQRHQRLHQRSGGGSFGAFLCPAISPTQAPRCAAGVEPPRPSRHPARGPAPTMAQRTSRTADPRRRPGQGRCTPAR